MVIAQSYTQTIFQLQRTHITGLKQIMGILSDPIRPVTKINLFIFGYHCYYTFFTQNLKVFSIFSIDSRVFLRQSGHKKSGGMLLASPPRGAKVVFNRTIQRNA
ncbi:hypothetical protein BRYFOR_09140 [Marvinbryantia formatexigens DSM 14469]|uniref:Uncharacterized protein n=1 Tax=Marvinbryantia formatexigens DSM 14469 TaxID=478749 RepID=C6LKF3_9FIRM|nr:hypothetical protein BRYFOR_09140 [Marvinbryantia formatexigens DSM 14469]